MSLKHRPTGDFNPEQLRGAPSDIGFLGIQSAGSILGDKICKLVDNAYRAISRALLGR